MKIVLDTNILISSTFWDGDSNKIVEKVENKEIELILSQEIMGEFTNVLNYDEIQSKIKDKNLEMKRTIQKIISISTIVEPLKKHNVIQEDPDDDKVIDCAIEGKVDYIITNDNHLLTLKEFQGIKIVTPREFLKITTKS